MVKNVKYVIDKKRVKEIIKKSLEPGYLVITEDDKVYDVDENGKGLNNKKLIPDPRYAVKPGDSIVIWENNIEIPLRVISYDKNSGLVTATLEDKYRDVVIELEKFGKSWKVFSVSNYEKR